MTEKPSAIESLKKALANTGGEMVPLAAKKAAYVFSGLNTDWDPQDHPRDPESGEFVSSPTGFIFGQTKSATFALHGKAQKIDLKPGDVAFKTGAGNLVVSHPDGSYSLHRATTGKVDTIPAGNHSIIATNVMEGAYQKVAENPGVNVEAKDQAEAADKLAHPDQYGKTATKAAKQPEFGKFPASDDLSYSALGDEYPLTTINAAGFGSGDVIEMVVGGQANSDETWKKKPEIWRGVLHAQGDKWRLDMGDGTTQNLGSGSGAYRMKKIGESDQFPENKGVQQPAPAQTIPGGIGEVMGIPTKQPKAKKPVQEPTTKAPAAVSPAQDASEDAKAIPVPPDLKPGKDKYTAKQVATYQAEAKGALLATGLGGAPILSGSWVEAPDGKPYLVHASPYGKGKVTAYRWVSTKQQASNLAKEDAFTIAGLANTKAIEDPTGKPYGVTEPAEADENEPAPKHGSLMSQAAVGAIPNTATAHKKHVESNAGKKMGGDKNGKPLFSGGWVEIEGKPVQVHSSPNEGNVAIAKWVSTKKQASNNTYDFPASVLAEATKISDPTGKPYVPLEQQSTDTSTTPVLSATPDGGTTFTHPVSGATTDLAPGEQVFQHKASPNTYIIAYPGHPAEGAFYTATGKPQKVPKTSAAKFEQYYAPITAAVSSPATSTQDVVEPSEIEPEKVEPVKIEPEKVEPPEVEPVKIEPEPVEAPLEEVDAYYADLLDSFAKGVITIADVQSISEFSNPVSKAAAHKLLAEVNKNEVLEPSVAPQDVTPEAAKAMKPGDTLFAHHKTANKKSWYVKRADGDFQQFTSDGMGKKGGESQVLAAIDSGNFDLSLAKPSDWPDTSESDAFAAQQQASGQNAPYSLGEADLIEETFTALPQGTIVAQHGPQSSTYLLKTADDEWSIMSGEAEGSWATLPDSSVASILAMNVGEDYYFPVLPDGSELNHEVIDNPLLYPVEKTTVHDHEIWEFRQGAWHTENGVLATPEMADILDDTYETNSALAQSIQDMDAGDELHVTKKKGSKKATIYEATQDGYFKNLSQPLLDQSNGMKSKDYLANYVLNSPAAALFEFQILAKGESSEEAAPKGQQFVHPVSGVVFPLEPGDKVYKHKTTPDGYVIKKASGENPINFFTQNGKQQKPKAHQKNLDKAYEAVDTWPGQVEEKNGEAVQPDIIPGQGATPDLVKNAAAGDAIYTYDKNDGALNQILTKKGSGGWQITDKNGSDLGSVMAATAVSLYAEDTEKWHFQFWPNGTQPTSSDPTPQGTAPTPEILNQAKSGDQVHSHAASDGSLLSVYTKTHDGFWVNENGFIAQEANLTDSNDLVTLTFYPAGTSPTTGGPDTAPWGGKSAAGTVQEDPKPHSTAPEPKPKKGKKAAKQALPKAYTKPDGTTISLKPGEAYGQTTNEYGEQVYIHVTQGPKSTYSNTNPIYQVDGSIAYWPKASKWTPTSLKSYIKKNGGELLAENVASTEKVDYSAYGTEGPLETFSQVGAYIQQKRTDFPLPTYSWGGGLNTYTGFEQYDGKSWNDLDYAQKMELISSYEEEAGKGVNTLEPLKSVDWLGDSKSAVSKTRTGFTLIHRVAVVAREMNNPDTDWDDDRFDGELATIATKVSSPGSALGKYLKGRYPLEEIYTALNAANQQRKFKNTLTDLDFDPYNGTPEEYDAYAKSKGFDHLAALPEVEQKLWILNEIGDPSLTAAKKEYIGKAADQVKTKVAVANLAASLHQQHVASGKVKKVPVKGVFDKSSLMDHYTWATANGSVSYEAQHVGSDEWVVSATNATNGSMGSVNFTDSAVAAVVNSTLEQGNPLTASTTPAYGTLDPVGELNKLGHKHGITEWSIVGGPDLAAIVGSLDGNVSTQDSGVLRRWLWAHVRGDEIAKYRIEVLSGTSPHPKSETHPGSPSSPIGKAAHKALAELLHSTPEGETYLSGGYISFTERKTLATALGLTNKAVPGFEDLTDDFYNWDLFHEQPVLAAHAPGSVGTASYEAAKPAGVPNDSWALVNTVEASTDLSTLFPVDDGIGALTDDELTINLNDNTIAAKAGLIGPLVAGLPTHMKRLALWGAVGDSEDAYRRGILASVAVRAKAGEFMTDSTPAWVAPNGTKFPISPGASVYDVSDQYGADTYLVTGPPKPDGTPDNTGWLFKPGQAPLKSSGFQINNVLNGNTGKRVFTMPGAVQWDQAHKDNPDLQKIFWDESALIEEGTSSAYTHHESGALLTAALKNNTVLQNEYPNLYGQHKSLPENIRQAILAALEQDHGPMLDVMEYKAQKGHYASMATKGLFDSAQPWLPFLSKGQVTQQQVADHWTPEAKSAYIKHFTLTGGEAQIAPHLDGLLNPETQTVTQALPNFDDLQLTFVKKKSVGAHSGIIWVDQDGNQWMTKAFPSDPNSKMRVDAEVSAMKIGHIFGFRNPAVHGGPVGKVTGGKENNYAYLQHLAPVDSKRSDLVGVQPGDLDIEQLSGVMQEHLLDWIVSNHDTHHQNVMFDPDGKPFGIDKGQAFKHFPKDKLAVGWRPGENPDPVWYDRFYNGLINGTISKEVADDVTKNVLRRAQQISKDHDDDYRAELTQATQNRTSYPSQFPDQQAFIDALVERKHNLFNDFVDFYQSLYAQSPYDFDIDTENLVPPKLDDHTHIAVSRDYANDVFKAGIHGKALFVDSADLEDSHIMFSKVIGTDKKPMLSGSARVRERSEQNLMAWLKKQTIENNVGHMPNSYNDYDTSTADVIDGSHLPGNTDYFAALVAGSKTVSSHNASGDQAYNEATLDKMDSAHQQVLAAQSALNTWKQENPDTPFKGTIASSGSGSTQFSELSVELHTMEQQQAWESMLQTYVGYAEKVNDHKGTDQKISPHFTQYAYTPSATALDLIKAKQAAGKDVKPFTPTKIEKILQQAKNGDTITMTLPDGTMNVYTKQHGGWLHDSGVSKPSSEDLEQMVKSSEGATFTYSGIVPGVPDADSLKIWTNQQDDNAQITLVDPDGDYVTYTSYDTQWSADGNSWLSATELHEAVTDHGYQIADVHTADEVAEISATVKVGSKVLKVSYRKAASQAGKLNDDGELEMTNSEISKFDWGHMYEIDFGNTVIEYRPWDPSAGVAKAHRGSLRFRKKNWDEDDDQSINDVLDVLRHIGLNIDSADEESMELFYWRHMTGVVRDRNDGKKAGRYAKIVQAVDDARKANPEMGPSEELAIQKQAWAAVIGQEKVDKANWRPRFGRSRIQPLVDHDDPFTSGRPHWTRPDLSASELKSIVGNSYVASSLKSGTALNLVKSGSAMSSDERYRVLSKDFTSGWSSETDAVSYGSSNVVYTRQNRSLNWSSGYDSHLYYHPKVMLRSHNYAFAGDSFGDYDKRKHSSYDPTDWKGYTGSGNELVLRYSASVLDDIAFVHFGSATERNAAIKHYKDQGITMIHGLPIEQVFVTDRQEGKKVMDKLWADMLADEQKAGA